MLSHRDFSPVQVIIKKKKHIFSPSLEPVVQKSNDTSFPESLEKWFAKNNKLFSKE